MPNHVTNIVSFSGKDAEKVALILSQNETFKFGFHPMPEELVGTRSPVRIVTEAEREQEIADYEARDEQHKKMIGRSFSITQKMSDELIEKYGTNNWYDWAYSNWGTKWAGYDGEMETPTRCRFMTAWSTPYPALVILSKQHPETTISIEFADEDFGSNTGRYKLLDGVMFDDYVPKYGYESLEIAFNVMGKPTHYLDYVFEQYDDSEESIAQFHTELDRGSYLTWAMDKMVQLDYMPYDDTPTFILKLIEAHAVAAENFELAGEIKGKIDAIVAQVK